MKLTIPACLASVLTMTLGAATAHAVPQPTYLNVLKHRAQRGPAQQKSEAETPPEAAGSQLAFIELTPVLGAMGLKGRTSFTTGAELSFHVAEKLPIYFEPSLLVSFLSGDEGSANASMFMLDAGMRYDFPISGSPVVPFLKVSVGPTLSSSSNTVVLGSKVANSYFNIFAGGGLKLLINPHFGARLDGGITLQGTDSGAYGLGSVVIPL